MTRFARHPFRHALLLALALATLPALSATPLPAPLADLQRLVAAGEVDAAVEAAERAVAALPQDAHAWWWAGRAYGRMAMEASLFTKAKWAGRTREAWERAVALDPKHVGAHLDLLTFYRAAPGIMGGGDDKARAQVATIAALDASLGRYAEATLRLPDDRPGAEALLHEAIALDGDNRRARYLLAGLAMEREDWAGARQAWEPALASAALVHVARYQLGKLSAVSGERLDEGLAHLDAFIAADPGDEELGLPAAQWRRGQILEKLGRRDEAIAAWHSAVGDREVGELARQDLQRVGAPLP